MKIIIFAGGTGKRFWPVSTKKAPKQFSPLISGKPLLRLRIDDLLKGFNIEDIFVSTGKRYEQEVREIVPELPIANIILESEMRDTGPAVMLAVSYVHNLYPNEIISTQWSDHINKQSDIFVQALKESERLIDDKIKTVFLTVPARFPSPHRGYIEFGNALTKISDQLNIYEFKKFKEKPDVATAQEYIDSGKFGWNPGYWTIDPKYYMAVIREFHPEMYAVCNEIVLSNFADEHVAKFSNLEKISADYAFAEHVDGDSARVLWADTGWSDVGEWIALKEALQESEDANVIKGNVVDLDSEDSIIFNLDDTKLISTIGLKGMVVVNTKDAVAIFSKDDNNRLKKYLEKLESEGYSEYL